MLKRSFSTVVMLCVAASLAAFGQSQGQEYLFQFSTPPNNLTSAIGYVASGNLSTAGYNINGPSGIAEILPTPDGTKFYLVGTAGPTSLQSVDANFDASSYHTINGLGASCAAGAAATCGAPTAATITPDGKYLLVSADQFYVIATANDQIVQALPINGQATFAPSTPGPQVCLSCWIGVTPDSQYAFLLTASGFSSIVEKISLTTLQSAGTLQLNSGATSISVSPTGQVYVGLLFRIYQIDPVTFTSTNYFGISFNPGQLHFTPDGMTAYTVNKSASAGGGVFAQINLANQTALYWTPQNPPQFDDILVGSSSRVFAYSSALGALYDVSTSPLSATVAAPSLVTSGSGIIDTVVRNEIITAAISQELPSAKYLFLLVANGNQTDLYRVDLTSNQLTSNTLSFFSTGVLQTAIQPATTGASQFLQFNSTQSIAANGGTSLPLVGQALTSGGLPVFGQQATFSTDTTTGLVINTPSATTNANGIVETTVTVPSTGASCALGVCTVTLTVGGASTTFTVNVPYSSTGGSGGGNGGGNSNSPQMSITSGDGQLIAAAFGSNAADPLTVLITSPSGTPLQNVPVTFALTSGVGTISANSVTTDSTGQASIYYQPTAISPGFIPVQVTASSQYGAVTFNETVFALGFQDAAPLLEIVTPSSGNVINVTAGTTVPGGIQAQIVWNGYECPSGLGTGCAIPGVGIQLYDPNNDPDSNTGNGVYSPTGTPAALKCVGSSDSNANGVASCNVQAAVCPAGGQTETRGIVIAVGNLVFRNYTAIISPGGANALQIVSGNNQTGNAGSVLVNPLVVEVLDACGNALPGTQVTWKVTQGQATLTQTNVITSVSGEATTSLTFGQTAGQIIVTASLANGSSTKFTLTSQAVATSLVLTSGGAQTGTTGQPFGAPLIFTLTDKSGNPVPGATINFTVTTGSATLSPTSTTTSSTGVAQTSVTAGATAGQIVITAAGAGLTATAQLVAQLPGPTLTPASFQNAASFQAGLVPCGLAVVTGNGVAPGIQGTVLGPSFGPLGFSLGPINSLTIGGIQAPISSVTNENGIQQATFQTPCELPTTSSTTSVVITVNNVATTIPGVQVLAAQPGIFTYSGPNNIQYGAVISAANSTYVTPSNYAVRGQTYYVIVTGLGQTTPAATTDNPGSGQPVNAEIIVGVNNAGVGTGSATYAPGIVGAYLVPFTIPLTAATGANQPLSVAAIVNGQVVYSNSVFLPGVQ